jgi:amino acid adenylation domain-containing protein
MSLSDERRALLGLLIRGARTTTSASAPHRDGPRVEPASYAQRRLWFVEQIQQDQSPYTLHAVLHLNWAVEPATLQRSINAIVQRHEVLRTTFTMGDGEPVQNIADKLELTVESLDFRHLPIAERESEVMRQLTGLLSRRFDLERGPLLRACLCRLDDRHSTFLLVVHHIVFDGPSFPIFFAELQSIYGDLSVGRWPTLPPRKVQYADFARELRSALTPERIAEEVRFWRTELNGVGTLDLPLDRPRPVMPNFRGEIHRLEIPSRLCAQLQQVATAYRTTLFTVLLAGAAVALGRVCDQVDFALGLPVTGRHSTELKDAIGFFVDTVVVRCRLHDNPTVRELMERFRSDVTRTLAHRALPFEMLVEKLCPARDLGTNPIFQVGFQLMHHASEGGSPGAELPHGAMFDLCFNLWMEGPGLGGRLEYNSALFDAATVERIAAVLYQTLDGLTEPGKRLSEIGHTAAQLEQVPSIVKGEQVSLEYGSISEVILEVADRCGDAVALEGPGWRFTYRELMQHAARLGESLVRAGAVPGSMVALVLPRSLELVRFELAVWQVGGTFVLVDPAWPESRRAGVLRDCGPTLIIDADRVREIGDGHAEHKSFTTRAAGDDPAYVIYTSGSTGEPKGVLLEQAGLVNVALAQRKVFNLRPGRRVAQLTSPSFDASIFEMVLALGSGATLVVPPQDLLVGGELAAFLTSETIDTVVLPPSLLATMRPTEVTGLRTICVAGESCPPDLADLWRNDREFWNLYGPTETTIWATFGCGQAAGRVPIGHVIPNMSAIVADRDLRPVPCGTVGELCLAGIGLARGYWNKPELTREKFVADPSHPARRMYRTGDLVSLSATGELIFLGRADRQVKVRGFRIEPEEVEVALRRHPAVKDAIVTARSMSSGETLLVAYVHCEKETPDVIDDCRRLLRESLPDYMVPGYFVPVGEFPRTHAGKIDLNALPLPHAVSLSNNLAEPVTGIERQVAEWMARATGMPRVGANDNFFRIGGHSLAAAQLVANVRAALHIDLKIRDVFFNPTVRGLAARIDELAAQGTDEEEMEIALVRLPRNPGPTVEEADAGRVTIDAREVS